MRNLLASSLLLAAFLSGPLLAGEHGERHERGERHEGRSLPVAENKLWRAECGGCHIAYPPGLLTEASWRAVMNGLDRHFGENASLDAADRKAITEFLAANASDRIGTRPAHSSAAVAPAQPPLRITELAWFDRKHDELRANVWKRKEVGSRANCGACHPGAEKGRFDEHEVVVPPAAARRADNGASR